MRRITNRLPSPAMVVACIALIIALGGTAWAATLPRNSVGTAQLKKNAVTSIKVRNNSLTGVDINEGLLGRVPSAARATTAASAERALRSDSADRAAAAATASTASSAPVSRLDYRTSFAVPVPTSPAHVRNTVSCDPGTFATGGGAKVSNPDVAFINDTNPVG